MKSCISCRHSFDLQEWRCPECRFEPTEVDSFISFAPEFAAECDGFDAGEFEKLFQLEKDSFWFKSRNKLINWGLNKHFSDARHLLEVGCGTGYVLSSIDKTNPKLSLYGTDVLVDGLKFANRRIPKGTFWQMDARNMPFRQEFDVICAFDVIEHIKEDEIVLEEFYKACTKNGGILLTVPQHMFLWSARDEEAHHVRRYERNELISKVERAGFKIKIVTSFVSLLLPALLLSRARKKPDNSFDVEAEYRHASKFGPALEMIMSTELQAIKLGLRLHSGGSLFLAATKD